MIEPKPHSCCTPTGIRGASPGALAVSVGAQKASSKFALADIPGTTRPVLGTSFPRIPNDGEELRPSKPIRPFRSMVTTVTNSDFAAFVDATGYRTEAERIGWSFVFWLDVPKSIETSQGVVGTEWWRRIDGANWRDINGPGTFAEAWHADHPVTQVSWNDARIFADWAGGRLPTEAEWEHAARGGLGDALYPWGGLDPNDTDVLPCNIWQGTFPNQNTSADGFSSTAPAQSFGPNGYGLYNVVGNVWEWTADPYRIRSLKKAAKAKMKSMAGLKVAKGGSFLCHRSYCWRYRIAARVGNYPDSTTPHMGFRLVFDTDEHTTAIG